MSIKTIFGWILKAPLILANLVTLGVSIYAAMGYVPGFLISWGAPAIIGGVQLIYLIGTYMLYSARKNVEQQDIQQPQTTEDTVVEYQE